jgi:hypothetical protein
MKYMGRTYIALLTLLNLSSHIMTASGIAEVILDEVHLKESPQGSLCSIGQMEMLRESVLSQVCHFGLRDGNDSRPRNEGILNCQS